jgi:hypothetical protein
MGMKEVEGVEVGRRKVQWAGNLWKDRLWSVNMLSNRLQSVRRRKEA